MRPMSSRTATAPAALVASALLAWACGGAEGSGTPTSGQDGATDAPAPRDTAVATFAGGCFWCMEPPFDELDGVLSTTSGYTGGRLENPTYDQVSSGETGHLEAVRIEYDPERIGYDALLHVFWRNVDPTDAGGQFCDRGSQYLTAIFYHTEEQKRAAEASRRELETSGRLPAPVVTEVVPAGDFYRAEDYHQDYYREHPIRYKFYRTTCGRDRRLRQLWGEVGG